MTILSSVLEKPMTGKALHFHANNTIKNNDTIPHSGGDFWKFS